QNWDDLLTSTTTDQHRSGKTLEEVSHLRIGDKRPQRLLPKGRLSIRVVMHISGVREIVLGSRVQQLGSSVIQLQHAVADTELRHVLVELLPATAKLGLKELRGVRDAVVGLHVLLELAMRLDVLLAKADDLACLVL